MTIEQIKEKIEYGDYNTLQKILNVKTVAAARMRFLRGEDDAVKAMQSIQENKEKFIKEFQTQNN
jgi:F0F1-type ATP synthase gamma subunit